ncbi:MAG TPA: UDP-N-acetylglucosamine 4,6-dehydratase [Saprospiraceae bacterium]|nr:UDP-N-acetylglucosamine 4,6-dehydratase [Saprospiraceae bacterium]HMQ81459.1 UDP-N-acetylglucosamine 4,6-dehydratase [Saprospiraceae bacterium]
MQFTNIEGFIAQHITKRSESLLAPDLEKNHQLLHDRIQGRSVLVIGGAGTIGSSYIKAMLRYQPERLVVIDTNENGLTELTRDLRSSFDLKVPEKYLTYPINFGDPVFEKLLKKEGPFEIVANFAAHKHVRSEKDHYSIEAMIDNNVIKAKRLLDLLHRQQPERFFCVSTDKAANPVNVMGASKKLMEEVILTYSTELPITTARFANVAFSNGSLLDGFIQRLMKKQPFSSPLDVKRYFVSPAESGQLCLLACMLGNSGEIFFPKLEEEQMVTFSDIGTAFLQELGYEPYFCDSEEEARQKAALMPNGSLFWPVYYFGSDTSGEKMFEEFYTEAEEVDWDRFHALGVVKGKSSLSHSTVNELFSQFEHLFEQDELNKAAIVELLQQIIPNFQHIEKGKHLDQRM